MAARARVTEPCSHLQSRLSRASAESKRYLARRTQLPVTVHRHLAWPADPVIHRENDNDTEQVACVVTTDNDTLICLEKHSTWLRALRTIALIQQFCANCRANANARRRGPLTAAELRDAEHVLIRQTQREQFSAEFEALQKGAPHGAPRKQPPASADTVPGQQWDAASRWPL